MELNAAVLYRRPVLSTADEGAPQGPKACPTGCAPSSAPSSSSAERGNRNGGTGDTRFPASVGDRCGEPMASRRLEDFEGQGHEVKDDHFEVRGEDDEEGGERLGDRSRKGRDSGGGRESRRGASLASGDVRSMVPGSSVALFSEVRHRKVYVCVCIVCIYTGADILMVLCYSYGWSRLEINGW